MAAHGAAGERGGAATVARDLATVPALAGLAALFGCPAYAERVRVDGVHRRTAAGGEQLVTALVLERVRPSG